MPEPLTSQLVAEQLQKLLVAFPRNLGSQNPAMMADVYRNGLRGLSGDAVRAAVDRAIQEDEYFPKVARLREAATAWQRYNTTTLAPKFAKDDRWCDRCQSRAEWLERWRPQVDARYNQIPTPDKLAFLLERYDRLLCKCAPPCGYHPSAGYDVPAMSLADYHAPRKRLVEKDHAAD